MESVGYIGIDASQKTLEIAIYGKRGTCKVGNQRREISHWLKALGKPARIGIESTGIYHQLLVEMAIKAGHTVYVLNPKDLSHYMRSLGRRGKTDRLDAQAIARYVAKEHEGLHAYQLPSALQAQIQELVNLRELVVKQQGALRQSAGHLRCKPKALLKLQQQQKQLLEELHQRLQELVRQDPDLAEHAKRLKGVVGFGELLSAVMAYLLTRRQFDHSDAAVAYVGIDPRAKDSGQRQGRRRLTKRGPGQIRRLLHNAAMAASKSRLWRPIYQRYLDRGLAKTEALVILSRKLLRIAYSMVKTKSAFNPKLIAKIA
jgi:transposase